MLLEETAAQKETIVRALRTRHLELVSKEGARRQLRMVRDQEVIRRDAANERQERARNAEILLQSLISKRRQHAMEYIESMTTSAVRKIYGPGYAIKFATFEEKAKTGQPGSFKMELCVSSPYKDRELVTGLVDERAGALVEVTAFALRIAFLRVLEYQGPLILDEAYSAMSHDGKINALAEFLGEVVRGTGRQIIFVTHSPGPFIPYASNIVRVEGEDGVARVVVKAEAIAEVADEWGEESWEEAAP